MAIRILNLNELLDALGVSADVTVEGFGTMQETLRQQQLAVDKFTARIVEETSQTVDYLVKFLHTNHCTNGDHRTVPLHPGDMVALFNLQAAIADMQVDLSRRIAHASFDSGIAIAKGQVPETDHVREALFGVLNGALMVMVELMQKHSLAASKPRGPVFNVHSVYDEFEPALRKRVSDQLDRMTGRNNKERPSREECH